ncbi:MAG: type II toxin-antitoxin system VapC family toxin [Leptolyngbya sp.]|nr:type II toxin-antitoxin system VapC family toxin [Candidatus Melainabacteria bacterium]
MKYLLDTHAFVWLESNPERLSHIVATLVRDLNNVLMLSITTVWEIQIKAQIGKLKLKFPLPVVVQNQVNDNQMQLLTVTLEHVLELDSLPLHHHDPFDRLLVAQARVENAILISSDPEIAKYDVQTIW